MKPLFLQKAFLLMSPHKILIERHQELKEYHKNTYNTVFLRPPPKHWERRTSRPNKLSPIFVKNCHRGKPSESKFCLM